MSSTILKEPKNGRSALHIAAEKGHAGIVKALLEAGAHVYENEIFNNNEEMQKFNVVRDILEDNIVAKSALEAIRNLEILDESFNDTIACLEAQPEGIIVNLVNICGENGSYYDHSEL